MPIYVHRCHKCGEEFDDLRPMQDANKEVECPKCGEKCRQVPSLNAKMKGNWSSWNTGS